MTNAERHPVGDPALSHAVLVGTATYRHPSYRGRNLPGVSANVAKLGSMLRQDVPWGLEPVRCLAVMNPTSADEILTAIESAGTQCRGTLFVYYAGHGFCSSTNPDELYLTHSGSAEDRQATALEYRHLRDALIHCGAPNKILVLDCCYAGNATRTMGALNGHLAIEGTFVLAATGPNRAARADSATGLTAFTNELVGVLGKDGVPGAGPFVSIEEVAARTHERLEASGLPLPTRQAHGYAGRRPIFKNYAHPATIAGLLDSLTEPEAQPAAPDPRLTLPYLAWGLLWSLAIGVACAAIVRSGHSEVWALRAGVVTGLLACAAFFATGAWLTRTGRRPSATGSRTIS
uniref:caspase family protein n=1 Tax=Micromonospora sp. WMMD987 TaxID=3016089 RepID=UPI002499CEB5|nr:caspase family protein [Micromonospora sp. WMMD987]WFE97511.1 caspase family protein [Micromonospora sp. WMMD987]